MGAGKVVPNERSKSHVSYYVAMVAIIGLIAMLCCYACYFFINKIRELSSNDSLSTIPSTSCPKKAPVAVAYPVQPVVRDSATAMAALCRQLPAGYIPQGDQVFPSGRSPDPRPTDTGPAPPPLPGTVPMPPPLPGSVALPPRTDPVDKLPVLPVPCITLEAATVTHE